MSITVFGSVNVDLTAYVETLPRPGVTAHAASYATGLGGKGANQAVAAARAGGEVTFIARVGDDMFGEQALKGFESDHINVKYVKTDETEPSGVALIFVITANSGRLDLIISIKLSFFLLSELMTISTPASPKFLTYPFKLAASPRFLINGRNPTL